MDNLIRAHNGLPIIQLDYTNSKGMVTVQENGSITDSQVVTDGRMTSIPALTRTLSRTIATTINGTLGFQHTNQITLAATPLITANEVYDAYVEYLGIPGSFVVSDCPPPPCAAHICRKCNGKYYWVPTEQDVPFIVEIGQCLL